MRSIFTSLTLSRLTGLLLLVCARLAFSADPIWIDIDTKASVAKVMRGSNSVLARYDNIALGKRGAAPMHFHGDDATPLGTYKIISIDKKSAFSVFFGLDYPTIAHAQKAMEMHKISKSQYMAILNAHFQNRTPPSNTPLGGAIGIHGIGNGSLRIHQQFNWTKGCVALDNKQINDLAHWATLGTRVVIH
ncbi:MAG TPA: L,D-transpeptidase [Pseudomonadales bacterium]|nr:L,D-transpeptidase [Pseudomonadales bacterium]